jgi:Arc/MetJ-type ribon-helix-helix transcriptional regulator
VKLSVSLPEEDVDFLDDYARRVGSPSRSAALHRAIGLLRHQELQDEYSDAWDEWDASEESTLWTAVTTDGVTDAPR